MMTICSQLDPGILKEHSTRFDAPEIKVVRKLKAQIESPEPNVLSASVLVKRDSRLRARISD